MINKKKIGILSMQRIKNYGSFLQAYGLRKLIEELGYEVQYVDYHVEEPVIKDSINGKNDKIFFEKGMQKQPFSSKCYGLRAKRCIGGRGTRRN